MNKNISDLISILGSGSRLLLKEAIQANNEKIIRIAETLLQALSTVDTPGDEDHEVG